MKVYVDKKGFVIKKCKDDEKPEGVHDLKEVKNVKEGRAIPVKLVVEDFHGFPELKLKRRKLTQEQIDKYNKKDIIDKK